MNKLIALTLVLCLMMTFTACKNDIGGPSYTLGNLTKNIFEIAKSGTYRMEISITGEGINSDYAIYAKDGMFAVDMGMRMIYKDGKSYIVMDSFEAVMVGNEEPDEDMTRFLPEESTLTYIDEGSGEFMGKTYKYDEYLNDKGTKMYFYVDGDVFKGIHTVDADGSLTDMEILAFDQNVPDSVFEIPANYEMIEEE